MENIVWSENVDKNSIPMVGGKGANLGEMANAGLPVPESFIITADAFWKFIKETKIKDKIFNILTGLDVNDDASLKRASNRVRELFNKANIPLDLEVDILNAYKELSESAGKKEEFVAVRSSATAEDLPEASFAGQQETFLNVHSEKDLMDKVRKCWSSLYTPRAIFYREKQGFPHNKVALAVVVQRMVNSKVSGVMFTSDPITGDPTILIEAGLGLGEAIVGGEITPDTYYVDQKDMNIKNKIVQKQTWKYTKNEKGNSIKARVSPGNQDAQKLPNKQIVEVAMLGKRIEDHYDQPMDVEWCLEDNKVYIVQARPVTTIKSGQGVEPETSVGVLDTKVEGVEVSDMSESKKSTGKILVKGLSASPGIGAGKVSLISGLDELDKVKKGNILVTEMTSPDMVPAMQRATAIVTDQGGTTCHAAIVSRELGIPCIVGTADATSVLKNGMEITVNASLGLVYDGIQDIHIESRQSEVVTAGGGVGVPVTATKVLINLGVPEAAEKHKHLPVQGIGLMREEFIVTSFIKHHPNALIDRGEAEKFIDALVEGIAKVAGAFSPRPVVMRTSDFKTNEYRELEGGDKYEPEEANPMIGWRGCSRYVSEDFEEAFRLELRAIKKVRTELGLKNLWVMLPFVRSVTECKKIIDMMKEEGLERGPDFKIWVMAEVPSNVFLADQFAELVDGFSIGSNDLTQLIMGADRDSAILGRMGYFDERNPAVTRAIAHLIKVAHEKGCTVSICGQAPSVYPEFTEFLVRHGIDSISLNPDTVLETIRLIARVEKKVMMERLARLSPDE
jgi:pyruvate,water dikinase